MRNINVANRFPRNSDETASFRFKNLGRNHSKYFTSSSETRHFIAKKMHNKNFNRTACGKFGKV